MRHPSRRQPGMAAQDDLGMRSPTNAKADLNRAGLWPTLSMKVHRVRWLRTVEAGFLPLRSFHDRQVLDPEDTGRFSTSVRCVWTGSFSPGPTESTGQALA